MMKLKTVSASVAFGAMVVFLSGCGVGVESASPDSSLGLIVGNVHGGRQAVVGAHIYVYAAGTTGDAGPGIAATALNASTSRLTAFSTGSFPTAQDANNNYYVTTDANGGFTLNGEYTCVPGTQVYLYSLGGKPDGVTANAAASFMAALGNCPAGGTMSSQTPVVFMNEVSTVAAAYAFAGFATDATHVSSSGSTAATLGIANAFANAVNLYDIGSGGGARSVPAFISGNAPQAEVNSLADSLAACVNSSGPGSTQCTSLFNNVKSGGSTGTAATETATVAINIAHNPTTAVSTVFNNSSGIGTPFVPTLSVAPNDYTVALTLYSGQLSFPTYVSVDGSGNVWVSSYSGGIDKYSPTGKLLSLPGYSGGGISHPAYIAFDVSGNAWIANQSGHTVSKLSPTGVPANTTGYAGNGDLDPVGLAIDASGFVWVTNNSLNSVAKLDSTGAEVSGSPYHPPSVANPWGVAIDSSGNAWLGEGSGGANIDELTSAGTTAGTAPFATGSYSWPRALAVNPAGGVWVANYNASSIVRTTSAGVGTNFTGGGLSNPIDVSIDGAGNVWTANHGTNSLSKFTSAGVAVTPATGYTAPDLNAIYGLAVDGSGNVWVTNGNGDTMLEFIGAAVPVVTPIVTGVVNHTLGTRP